MTRRFLLAVVVWAALAASAAPALERATGDGDARLVPSRPGTPALRIFTDRDGLPQNNILCVVLDARGYLWVGTDEGAAFYNGRTWTVVNVPTSGGSREVIAILGASDGSMWFGTRSDLYRLDRGEWTAVDLKAIGFPSNRAGAIVERASEDGKLEVWVAAVGGAARFDGERWTALRFADFGLPSSSVRCLLLEASPKRGVWMGTMTGLVRYEDGAVTAYTKANSPLPDDDIWSLAEVVSDDGARALWVGTHHAGVTRVEGDSWTTFSTDTSPIPGNAIYCIAGDQLADGARVLWIGTDEGGLAKLHLGSGAWETFDTANSELPGNRVQCLLRTSDARRQLWIGTLGGGLACMTDGQWQRVHSRNSALPNDLVNALLETVEPDGRSVYWIGTEGGLARYDRGTWSVFTERDGLPNRIVWSLYETDGAEPALWVSTTEGLAKYQRGRWQVFTPENSGLSHKIVASMIETSAISGQKELIFGTNDGQLARYESGRIVALSALNAKLPRGQVWDMAETTSHDGSPTLWLAMNLGGLARVANGEVEVFDTTNSPLPSTSVQTLLTTDDGRRLWAGTLNGAVRIDVDTKAPVWAAVDALVDPAPPNRGVTAIQRDTLGRIYVFTTGGVARLTPRARAEGERLEYDGYVYTVQDGLPSNVCSLQAALIDRAGRVWTGTTAGAAFFEPAAATEPGSSPRLFVERMTVAGRSEPLRPNEELAHGSNNLEFEFALLSYFKEDETRYRTQLIGFDREPTEWSAVPTRTYTNLPAGTFTFAVWARGHDNVVSGPLYLPFTVRPAPWQTWWAFLGYIGIGIAAVYGGTQWRLRTTRKRTEELEKTVSARTMELAEARDEALVAKEVAIEASKAKSTFLANMSHELRTPLNAVIGFAQVMERSDTLGQTDRQNLAIIQRSGEHLLGLINDILSISRIEAGKLVLELTPFDLHLMLDTVEVMIRARAEAKRLPLSVEADPSLPRFVRGDEGRLRQVLINLLGNGVKFTERGFVVLRARWSPVGGGRAYFEVEDTGQGIAEDELGKLFQAFSQTQSGMKAHEGTGLGLTISQSFVRLMGGHINVFSTPGKGTVFGFDVNLPEATVAEVPSARKVDGLEPGQDWRILVTDDVPENRRLLEMLLVSVGFDVRGAETGAEAVETWRSWKPHFIWMDLRMPVMDGTEATRAIRDAEREEGEGGRPRTIVVGLTASAFESDREEFLRCGLDDFVSKPFRETTIFDKLAEHLGVRFTYAAKTTSTEDGERSIDPARLTRLAEDQRSALRHALETGDARAASHLAERIRATDEALGLALLGEIRAFRLDALLGMLEEIDSKQ